MKTKVKLKEAKEITLNDLTRLDHIGFHHEHESEKGYISMVIVNGKTKLIALSATSDDSQMCDVYTNCIHDTIKEIFEKGPSDIHGIYRFDTRKELYQWLAE